jgi:DNA-binding GntR family transcriptional regulator
MILRKLQQLQLFARSLMTFNFLREEIKWSCTTNISVIAMKKTSGDTTPVAYSPAMHETSMTQQAYERLQEMLITLEISPGSMISENQIAKWLDLGRTPVREAVHRLAQEGLLEIHKSRGILVPDLSIVRQLDLLDVRRQLEPYVSMKAAKNASAEQRQEMNQLAKHIIESASTDSTLSFMRVNRNVHAIKIAAAGNTILTKVMESFYGISMRFWYAHHRIIADSLPQAAKLHAGILNAIAAGDDNKAAEETLLLMSFLEKFTRQTLER